jgi:hypothetical protein
MEIRMEPLLQNLNFMDLTEEETQSVREAITRRENFCGYIPGEEKALSFIVRNFLKLSQFGILEDNWITAYTHASHFEAYGIETIQRIFDHCDRDVLRALKPIPEVGRFSEGRRFSLFRGCAGQNHTMGMSWSSSLDKAIWYAAHHVAWYELENPKVYAAVVDRSEIYCCGDHYDIDYIVHPKSCWPIEIPAVEFRLDRPR